MTRRRSGCGSGCGGTPCGLCNSNPCGCGASSCQDVVPPAPTPYYNCADVCVEDHDRVQVRAAYAASIRVANAFNMPDCDESAELRVTGLVSIAIGSYIWNASVGFLEVVAFNPSTGIITVQNNCEVGNASPGTTFPACTLFVVTVPPTINADPGGDGIFVAIDFTAPAVSTCLLITVTSVTGISAGNNVQIGGATYRVSEVNSATTITICNDGAGLTPGSPVVAKNGAGQYQYPVTLITVNPCDLDLAQSGTLIGCVDGVATGLTGDAAGQVFQLTNPVTGEGEYVTLSVQVRTCTLIQCCLVLTPGTLQYTITVADSSEFTVGDIAQIGTRAERWTIDSIPDATHIIATTDTNPVALETIADGSTFCIIDCCEENAIAIACDTQVYTTTIPIFFERDGVELDENGYMALRIGGEEGLFTYEATDDCPNNIQIVAHAFVGLYTAFGNDYDAEADFIIPAPIYNEVELVWDVGPIPTGNRAGKMVWTENIAGFMLPSGYPLDIASLFNQAPGLVGEGYPVNYHGNYVSAAAQIDNTQTTNLTLYFRTLVNEDPTLQPSVYDSFGVYVVGWVEVKRYDIIS